MNVEAPGRATPEQEFGRWLRQGDAAALGRVFDRLAPELLLVAAHLADRTSAEDLVQATFVAAITDGDRWQADRALMPWLIGILANLVRRERDRAARPLDPSRLSTPSADDPRSLAEREETARLLAAALRGVPRRYREVLTLRLVHGLEPLAIAHALGAPPATIKSRLQRGLSMLQRALPVGLRTLALVPLALPVPTLAGMRAALVTHAQAHAGAGLAAGAAITTGGLLMTKKLVGMVVAVAVALAAIVWLPGWWSGDGSVARGEGVRREVASARQETVANAASSPSAAPPSSSNAAPEALRREPSAASQASSTAAQSPAAPPAAALLRGRVVDEAGDPLAGIAVYLGDKTELLFRDEVHFLGHVAFGLATAARVAEAMVGRTAADGTFALPRPRHDRPHLLVAWSELRGCRAIDLPRDLATPIEIVLPRDPVVTGVVRSAIDQRAVVGARVRCWPSGNGIEVDHRRTDADGRFRLVPLRAGDYRLTIEAEGFARHQTTFRSSAVEATAELAFELSPLPTIDLLLIDPAGQAWTPQRLGREPGIDAPQLVAFASRRAYRRPSEREADAGASQPLQLHDDGHLRGALADPTARVFSLWSGSEKLMEVVDFDPRRERLVAELLPRHTIPLPVVIVFRPALSKTPEVRLAVTDPSGFTTRMPVLVETRATAASAVLAVPAQFAGTECGLLAECDGCAPFFTVLPVPARVDGTWCEVALSPASGALRGLVVDAAGKPVPDAAVQLVDVDGHWFLPPLQTRRYADHDGAFAFTGAPPRRAWLMVSADGFAARGFAVDLGADHQRAPQRFELRRGRVVEIVMPLKMAPRHVVVRDGSGRPLADGRVAGAMLHGVLKVTVDADAAVVVVHDAVTGALLGEGAVPADGARLQLREPR